MKTNFPEIVKQKTDKELEIISKDYVFYSEQERLVALNELESRNGLTKELSASKEEIEPSMEIEPTVTEQAQEAVKSQKRIYKTHAIWVGTFLGGPLVAGYLIAENFKAFNEVSRARRTWIFAVLGTVLTFCIAFLIPDDVKLPSQTIPLVYTTIAYLLVKRFQGRNISAYLALGGKPFGWWRAIAVSLIGFAITAVLLLIVIFVLIS